MTSYDAIVVGAGLNGLVAGYLLAKAGWGVLVLDQHAEPGGAIRSGEYTLPGFRHDFGAGNLSTLAASPFWREHGDALAGQGVRLIAADRPFGTAFPDGSFLGVSTDFGETLQTIRAVSPHDAGAWSGWQRDYLLVGEALNGILGAPPHQFHPLRYDFGAADLDPDDATILDRLLVDSIRETLASRFQSDEVRALIAPWGMHLDLAPDVAGGSWMPFLETNAASRNGIAIAQGGSGTVTRALADLIAGCGGTVQLGMPVEQVAIQNGAARGVRTSEGEEIRAHRAVVASVTPPALVRLLGEDAPIDLIWGGRRWRFGPGTLLLHLALDAPLAWRAEGARRSYYVHLNATLDRLARTYQQALAGLLPDEPLLVVGQPTLFDPSRAPAGKHTLWVMVRAVPAVVRGDAAGRIAPRPWPEVKATYAERMLDILESFAPGTRDRILLLAVVGPDDFERENPNLVGGDLAAGSHHLSQFYNRRPLPGWAQYRTPIPGLYLAGAATFPGAGAQPASGMAVARLLTAD